MFLASQSDTKTTKAITRKANTKPFLSINYYIDSIYGHSIYETEDNTQEIFYKIKTNKLDLAKKLILYS